MRLPELKALEAFESPEVTLKFSRDFKVSLEESRMLFRETMKMLWLMVKHSNEKKTPTGCIIPADFNVQKSMDPLDKMWHEFILFTREYHQFCETFFGGYLHHVPCSDKESQAFQLRKEERKEGFVQMERQELRVFVKYIQENLGNETLNTWFKEVPQMELSK